MVLDPIKHVLLEKRVSKRVHDNDAFVNIGNKLFEKNKKHCILIRRRFYRI